MTTKIDSLEYDDEKETKNEDEIIDPDNLSKSITDFTLSEKTRIKVLNMFYEKDTDGNTIEVVNKIAMMYELSGTKLLREFLFNIVQKSIISPFLKSIAAISLCSHDDKDSLGYEAVDTVFPLLGLDVGTPYKIDMIKILMKNEKYKEKATTHFCNTINDNSIDCKYRFTIIDKLGSDNSSDSLKQKYDYFAREAYHCFIRNDKNQTFYRVLAGQHIIASDKENQEITGTQRFQEVEQILLSFANDEKVEYNIRADSADVLLQSKNIEVKTQAQKVIFDLGKNGKNIVLSIFDNAQNVHTKEVEDSVKEAIEFLQSFELMKMENNKPIDINFVEKKIYEFFDQEYKVSETDRILSREKIEVSLNRIKLDRALYSSYNCTLKHILLQIWTYTSGNKNEADIKRRLMEELIEMAGTCSSGFASRIINTISGFGDFSMRISWKDQIIANFTGRLNARIRDMDDLNLQEKVLEQMTIDPSKYNERKHFMRYFRENIPFIREEMYQEFISHIPASDFDLYFRSALSMYESGTQ